MAGEMVEREPRRIWLRVGGNSKVEQKLRETLVEIDSVEETIDQILFGNVLARARQKTVICEGV